MKIVASAADLPLDDESVHCIVTSPPYGVGVAYDGYDDVAPWSDAYFDLMRFAAVQMERVLVPGGRAWVNVMPAVPIDEDAGHAFGSRYDLASAWCDALLEAGLAYRDTIVWVQDSHDGACAWGSWARPSAPNLRGGYEVVLSMFKGAWRREAPAAWKGWREDRHDYGDVGPLDPLTPWVDLTRNTWKINPVPRRAGPAAFPLELPARAIRLSTWPGETVLDPFAGTCVTERAARLLGRVGVSVDVSPAEMARGPYA